LSPAEEMIWSKAFILERERFDGADVAHLLFARGPELDWTRLLERFDRHWRVLLAHLVLFGFIYPGQRSRIPAPVMSTLLARMEQELRAADASTRTIEGTLLSRAQYLPDLAAGFRDGRLAGDVHMTPEEIAIWTRAIEENEVAHHGREQQRDDPRRRRRRPALR